MDKIKFMVVAGEEGNVEKLFGNMQNTSLKKIIEQGSWKEKRELQDISGSVFCHHCFKWRMGKDFRSSEKYQTESGFHKSRELISSNKNVPAMIRF